LLPSKSLSYLEDKLAYKHQWAKCIVKKHFILGVSTTSRVESFHKILSQHLNSNSRLNLLLQVFKQIESTQAENFKEEFGRHSKNQKNDLSKSPLLKQISEIYSPYIIKKVECRFSKAVSYKVEQLSPNKWYFISINLINIFNRAVENAYIENPNTFLVYKKGNKIFCDCKESVYFGLPCRHEMVICMKIFHDFQILHFEKRWEINYYKFEEVKEEELINSLKSDGENKVIR